MHLHLLAIQVGNYSGDEPSIRIQVCVEVASKILMSFLWLF